MSKFISPLPFDIETGPRAIDEMIAVAGEFNPDEVSLGNLKDAGKIEEKIEQARAAYPATLQSRGCLDPMLGKVMAIGIISRRDEVLIFDGHADERSALADFWRMAEENRQLGFEGWNIFGFDLDFLRLRSMLLKVAMPKWVFTLSGGGFLSYRNDFTDLMFEVTGSPKKYLKLDTFAKAIGFAGKSHASSGADFWKDWTSPEVEKRDNAKIYLTADLRQTQGVGAHIREFGGLLLPMGACGAPASSDDEDVPYDRALAV